MIEGKVYAKAEHCKYTGVNDKKDIIIAVNTLYTGMHDFSKVKFYIIYINCAQYS